MDNMILCENLVKIYKTKDAEVIALQGLDLQVAEGEMVAIIGSSGSGKSTLMNIIGGLDTSDAGKLEVAGIDLMKLSPAELVDYKLNTVGFIWQNNARNLVPYLTALQNIMLPMRIQGKVNPERAMELAEVVGLKDRINSNLYQLSGGEQQRVAIALALANDPKIILADEPTGAVDSLTCNHIMDLFRSINQQLHKTIVIVTHDLNLSKKVDRVVAIRDGRTSSEYIRKREDLIGGFTDTSSHADTHDEYIVLDKAGRLQIPAELLKQSNIKGNKVRVELVDGDIVIKGYH